MHTHQSICYLHIQSSDVDEDSDKKLGPLSLLDTSAWAVKGGFYVYAISIKISYTGPCDKNVFSLSLTALNNYSSLTYLSDKGTYILIYSLVSSTGDFGTIPYA